MNMRNLDSSLIGGKACPTLDEFQYDAVIIYVGISDILRSKSEKVLNKLSNKITDIAWKLLYRQNFHFVNLTNKHKQ